MDVLECREYGDSGSLVVLLHGGPGASGYLAPVARDLAGPFCVLEPLQRRSGRVPLTVSRHVEDLRALLASRAEGPPALVGHSWGAMLALAYAAAYPGDVASIVLVGCGTFDEVARGRLHEAREARTSEAQRRRLERLPDDVPDPDLRLREYARLMLPIDSYDLASEDVSFEACDARGFRETWDDMLRLQKERVVPPAFRAITAPVLMLHGDHDTLPGRMIRASLAPHLPQIEYRELPRCGHYPWLERAARGPFLAVLRGWLAASFRSRDR
jgi:pimeloyl-ACP methyl ester carboxylesterase